ncbi:2-C-methyl-D-erythritol 2,4-cyclodiphosphate synthase [Elusimicrobiota bacterium]
MYIGIGYDVHRLKKGEALVLGGIKIKHTHGLIGHSDADVLIHALMDSLLGAAGLNDIGHFFPNTDLKYKGISSVLLLEKVIKKLKSMKLKVQNVDISVIAEKPKISVYIPKMKKVLSKAINISEKKIGIKATTNEQIGFIGRGEGIASLSIALLKKRST